jgi:hypothetical protein
MKSTKGSVNEYNHLLKTMRVENKACDDYLDRYLKDVFREISIQEGDGYLTEYVFSKYLNIPLILSQKIFVNLNSNDGNMEYSHFIEFFKVLHIGCYDILTKYIFDILDFNKDGLIFLNDCRVILFHIAMFVNENKISQEKIATKTDDMLKLTFSKTHLSLKDFRSCIEKRNSDLFFSIVLFLMVRTPFNDEILTYYKNDKRILSYKKNVKWIDKVALIKYSDNIKTFVGIDNYSRLTTTEFNRLYFNNQAADEDELELQNIEDIEITEIYDFSPVSPFKNPHLYYMRMSNANLISLAPVKTYNENNPPGTNNSLLMRTKTNYDRVYIINNRVRLRRGSS